MKLHHTAVEKLIKLIEINSGWKEQWKLKQALAELDLTVYKQQSGQEVLVTTEDMQRETNKAKQDIKKQTNP